MFVALLGLVSCRAGGTETAAAYPADVATRWFELAYRLTRTEGLSPPVASRAFAYEGVALYEAVVSGMPDHRSLAGQVNGELTPPNTLKDARYSWPVAANAALATTMTAMYRTENSYLAILSLHDQIKSGLQRDLSIDVATRSEDYGRSVGVAVLRWAHGDGYESINNCSYTVPSLAGAWIPTPPAYANPLEPCWGRLRPFVMRSVAEFRAAPPPPYSENPSSQFYLEAKEVYDVVRELTPEQRAIAVYWADNPGQTGTPPGHSTALATQILTEQKQNLGVAAETYSRVGMAVADAFISCWDTKYVYNLIRPVSYIRLLIDPVWISPIATPPFPEYSSGHSVQTAAAVEVLKSIFGDIAITDRVHEGWGLQPRSFQSLSDLAKETAISRLYGGIHYRAAIDRGLEQGVAIGKAVNAINWRD